MIVNKDSWHFKLYRATYWYRVGPPAQTNLCQYVRRLVLGPIFSFGLGFPIALVLLAMYAVIFASKTLIWMFFGIGRPVNLALDVPFVPYDGWKVAGVRLYPWHVLGPVMLALLHWATYRAGNPFIVMLTIDGIAVLFFGLLAIMVFYNSDTGTLVRATIAAKKARVCPLVEFAASPTETE